MKSLIRRCVITYGVCLCPGVLWTGVADPIPGASELVKSLKQKVRGRGREGRGREGGREREREGGRGREREGERVGEGGGVGEREREGE